MSKIYCHSNQLSAISVTQNTALRLFSCYNNYNIAALNLDSNTELTELNCGGNKLTSLNLSANSKLIKLYCAVNQLTYLNIANGNNTNFQEIEASVNNALNCIQVDDVGYSNNQWTGTKFVFDVTSNFSVSCGTASIDDYLLSSTIKTYPIPVINQLHISIDKNDHMDIKLMDLSGKIIVNEQYSNHIDFSSFSKGVYFLQLKTKKGTAIKKIIKGYTN